MDHIKAEPGPSRFGTSDEKTRDQLRTLRQVPLLTRTDGVGGISRILQLHDAVAMYATKQTEQTGRFTGPKQVVSQ